MEKTRLTITIEGKDKDIFLSIKSVDIREERYFPFHNRKTFFEFDKVAIGVDVLTGL